MAKKNSEITALNLLVSFAKENEVMPAVLPEIKGQISQDEHFLVNYYFIFLRKKTITT